MILYKLYGYSLEALLFIIRGFDHLGISFVPALSSRLDFKGSEKKVWIHAASIGEVRGIYSLVKKILEEVGAKDIIFTTTSESGKKELTRLLPAVDVVLAPIDTPRIVQKFLRTYRPNLLIINETELWPSQLTESNKLGLACILVNGRISDRSFKTYYFFRLFFTKVLDNFQKIFVQSELDKSRFEAIGAKCEIVEVAGLTKFDFPISELSSSFSNWWQKFQSHVSFGDKTFIITLGSIREEEEGEVLECVSEMVSLSAVSDIKPIFIIAPRHPERFLEIFKFIKDAGLSVVKRSSEEFEGSPQVIILDTIGELLDAYAAADVCFVGGTFSPVGGHNVLEPAYFGKPIFVGPNTQNIRDVAEKLEKSAALIRVSDGTTLAREVYNLAIDVNRLVLMGDASLGVVAGIKGATNRIYQGMKNIGVLSLACLMYLMFGLSACSPTKGYQGPELPETELALVYFADCDPHVKKVRASSEGVEFGGSGISLLPGKRIFDSFVEVPYTPYDCVPETTFDQSGYDSCMSRRYEAISKSKKYIPDCFVSSYEKTVYWCSQNFKQFLCSSTANLVKAQKYDLCVSHLSGAVKAKVITQQKPEVLNEVDCNFTTEEVRRLEFSSPY